MTEYKAIMTCISDWAKMRNQEVVSRCAVSPNGQLAPLRSTKIYKNLIPSSKIAAPQKLNGISSYSIWLRGSRKSLILKVIRAPKR